MKSSALFLSAVVLMFAPIGGALAHHSGAMFDFTKEVNLQGTVKEWQYTNPHAWLMVSVPDASGKVTIWSFEGGDPSGLLRSGIKKSSFLPGDKVTVKGRPMKDGRPGAALLSVTKADGTVLSQRRGGEAPAFAPRPPG